MDPKKAPDFVPPSDKEPYPSPSPADRIPKNDPIQPYVLADYLNSLDAPISQHERSKPVKSKSKHSKSRAGSTSSMKAPHSIPRIHSQMQKSSSSSDEDDSSDSSQPQQHQHQHQHSAAHYTKRHQPAPNTRSAGSVDPKQSAAAETGDDGSAGLASATAAPAALSQAPALEPAPKQSAKTASVSEASTAKTDLNPSSLDTGSADSSHRRSVLGADLEEVPHGIVRQANTFENYKFPAHRLKEKLTDNNKYPLVVVACGSFSPITYLHLRMFEMALDAIQENTRFEVVGGYYSPVSDHYKKSGLAPSYHRVRMCELACERTSNWLMVDAWESLQPSYTRTALVLDHFNEEINVKRGGIYSADGKTKRGVKIMLLAGGDLIVSMGEPNVWAENDLHHILGSYGCLIVERTGSDVRSFLLSHDILYEHRKNILVIKQLIYNDISSTKVRLFIRRGMSVQYLLPNSVIRYIQEHRLYINTTEPVKQVMDNDE